ncbi:DUF1960-domain-containing protein [Mycena pura]|uniref:DUF1960-domain-containing protein n=1 Tax=Mycena pura TaxID=153505 RepID=A0AAD6YSL1_9AGAR|nr:DUF1960-domain-containing protein [Mycena pura]
MTNPRKTNKVIYKPDPQSTDEYTVFVADVEKYKEWKEGAFDVFWSSQGAQGVLGKPSQQQLDTIFGNHDEDDDDGKHDDDKVVGKHRKRSDVDVVTEILKKGRMQGTDAVASHTFTGGNASRGNDNLSRGNDNRG